MHGQGFPQYNFQPGRAGEAQMLSIALQPVQRRNPQVPENPDFGIVNLRVTSRPHAWRPPTDVYEREDSLIVRVEIAGMKEDDFIIQLDQNMLVIRGTRTDLNERRAYHQMEINFGEFQTSIELQVPVDAENVRAEYQDGFLWVFLPKSQPRIIKIKENE
jgi:HSP20 family protein